MKKITSTLLIAVLLAFIFSASFFSTEAQSYFTDVNDRYKTAVDHLVTKKYAQGISDTRFGTDREILRIDAAVMVAKVMGYTPESKSPDAGFTDVPSNRAWAVNALAHAGVINGKSSTSYGSYDTMTRSEMAKVIASAYNLTSSHNSIPFTDVNPKFAGYVAALVEAEITFGTEPTKFGAYDNITRGQFSLFVYRADLLSLDTTPPEVISVD
ncbi:S-layer homology domain-containing protein [Planococcus salinus]|uniref:S-layer homology domain-containing protein n=1 Tax=Planococcus salinus TaxID=1848460 RepID=UPI001314C0AD|nr:S-layer homology domain-containing protein [Planococcus salinus]